jgi:hypothetical protein
MEYLWAWGTLIHEKNLISKISCQAPFNVSVSDLYIPRIGPHFSLQQNRQTDPGNI